jgi:hypothetical protein
MLPNWLIEARFAEEGDLSKLLDFARRQPPEENVWFLGPTGEVGGSNPNYQS